MRGHPDFEFLLRRQAQLNAPNRSGTAIAPGSTRVLVAESSRLVAEALMLAIDIEPTLEPIGYALDGWEAIDLAETLCPDVIVVGAQLGGLDAFTLAGLVKEFWPSVRVIRLSLDYSADELIDAIAAASARGALAEVSYV
jgi:DNA-binding NarL/FixJ family response regulator